MRRSAWIIALFAGATAAGAVWIGGDTSPRIERSMVAVAPHSDDPLFRAAALPDAPAAVEAPPTKAEASREDDDPLDPSNPKTLALSGRVLEDGAPVAGVEIEARDDRRELMSFISPSDPTIAKFA